MRLDCVTWILRIYMHPMSVCYPVCVLENEEGVAAVKWHSRLQRYMSKER